MIVFIFKSSWSWKWQSWYKEITTEGPFPQALVFPGLICSEMLPQALLTCGPGIVKGHQSINLLVECP